MGGERCGRRVGDVAWRVAPRGKVAQRHFAVPLHATRAELRAPQQLDLRRQRRRQSRALRVRCATLRRLPVDRVLCAGSHSHRHVDDAGSATSDPMSVIRCVHRHVDNVRSATSNPMSIAKARSETSTADAGVNL